MKIQILSALISTIFASCHSQAQEPKLLLIDKEDLAVYESQANFESGAALARTAVAEHTEKSATLKVADEALAKPNHTVVEKAIVPPSGDKHDFYSQAAYYWPNPKTEDGLPYIHKDGKGNPEISKHKDNAYLFQLCRDVNALGLAYYATSDNKYAKKAADLTRAWFVNESTRMNPNFNYGQFVPGKNHGRSMVFADTYYLVNLLDGIQLISTSGEWSGEDMNALKEWFDELITWMTTSELGKQGQSQPNNVGSLYDMQLVAYSLFVGKTDLAKRTLETRVRSRIDGQLDNAGTQILEVKRASSWGYSIKNLNALINTAQLAEKIDVDLWNYESADGKSIKKALLYMLPYAQGKKKWSHGKANQVDDEKLKMLLRRASSRYNDVDESLLDLAKSEK